MASVSTAVDNLGSQSVSSNASTRYVVIVQSTPGSIPNTNISAALSSTGTYASTSWPRAQTAAAANRSGALAVLANATGGGAGGGGGGVGAPWERVNVTAQLLPPVRYAVGGAAW